MLVDFRWRGLGLSCGFAGMYWGDGRIGSGAIGDILRGFIIGDGLTGPGPGNCLGL